ncbi:MAG: hypothetical protein LBT53_02825 [Puniceicoccales bacterium]|jgi:hypothetical protein|nr:hypothetical protein [Puniceicoccales bacterium]
MKILTKLKHIALSNALLLGAATTASCDKVPLGPTAQITFIVKDDFGKPVANADVTMSTFHHWEPGGEWGKDVRKKYRTKTDDTGRAVLSGESATGRFTYGAFADSGYYYNGRLEYNFKEKKLGRWEPWNPTVEIIYKPILKPIPMYHGGRRFVVPVRGEKIGFDLVKNDWVVPHGKGELSDFVFKLDEIIPFESVHKPFDYRLKITFPNKGDGIQSWFGPVISAGEMPMPRYAPTDGYINRLEQKFWSDKKNWYKQREDQNYFFRIRTKMDANGKIVSAMYGKIQGNIDCDVINSKTGILFFEYHLNPVALDVNMEFDKKKNLLPEPR